jgi:hypothetical protein
MNLFSKLEKVTVANPRNPGFDFLVKNAKNALFEIQKHTFISLGLSNQSLAQYVNPDVDDTNIYIKVEDGDDGTFLKNSNRGSQKSHTFKNIQLMNLLAEQFALVDGSELVLEEVDKNYNLYKLVPKGSQSKSEDKTETEIVPSTDTVEAQPESEMEQSELAVFSDGEPMGESEDEVSLFD